jgi:hypothetical protein
MRRLPNVLAALVSLSPLAAAAAPVLAQISDPSPPPTASPPLRTTLSVTPEIETCAPTTALPFELKDASDPLWFASGPTAQLNAEELHANMLRPLVSVGVVHGAPHLYIIGAPAGTSLGYTLSGGWRPRWPFC